MLPRSFLLLLVLAGLLWFAPAARAASDFQFAVAASGFSAYQLTSVSDPQVFFGPLTTLNPTLNLILGQRYGVANPDHLFHPFQVIAAGADAFSDVVLLSQDAAAGSFEADPAVAWTDSGTGTAEFTLTPALLTAMRAGGHAPGYRCGVHTSTMRGGFAVFGDGVPIANPIAARIPAGTVRVELTTFTAGLTAPLGADFAADGRAFVYDQAGKVWIVQGGSRLATPFLDVTARLVPLGIQGPGSYDERGLLGFALHPGFAANRKFYTHTSEPVAGPADYTVALPVGVVHDHQEVIAEWTASAGNPNVADPASRRELLRVDKPQFNHNGGAIRFGPDGFLYLGLGDGGAGDDEGNGHGATGNGQNLNVALGKILRIDVDGRNSANARYGIPADNPFAGVAGLDDIFFFGVRNPYSFSFDRTGGALWIGEVGQNSIEEIDTLTAAQKGGNLGWRLKEGTFYFDPRGTAAGAVVTVPVQPLPPGLIDPVAEYDHDDGSAIVGGFVYRGTVLSELVGKYVCGDFGGFTDPSGRLFYLDAGNVIRELVIAGGRPLGLWVKGFAQDRAGEIYVCGSRALGPSGTSGVVMKLTRPNAVARAWAWYQ